MRLTLTPELSSWLMDRIAAFGVESPPQLQWLAEYVTQAGALPLYVGWIETIGLRPDGDIVCWSTEGDYPGTKPANDRNWWLTALADAAKRYPELRSLLPVRPQGARDCRHLLHPMFAEDKVLCSECCGLGWVATDAEPDPARD